MKGPLKGIESWFCMVSYRPGSKLCSHLCIARSLARSLSLSLCVFEIKHVLCNSWHTCFPPWRELKDPDALDQMPTWSHLWCNVKTQRDLHEHAALVRCLFLMSDHTELKERCNCIWCLAIHTINEEILKSNVHEPNRRTLKCQPSAQLRRMSCGDVCSSSSRWITDICSSRWRWSGRCIADSGEVTTYVTLM